MFNNPSNSSIIILIIVIFFKTGERLTGAVVRIGQDPNRNNPDCGPGITLADIESSAVIEVDCDFVGRYLSITLPDNGVALALCDVKVYPGPCS